MGRKKKVVKVVPKPKKAKKPRPTTENDILNLGAPNLNSLPVLYEDRELEDDEAIFPPDLTTQYTEAELDSSVPGSEFWKLLRLASARWSAQRLCIEVGGRRNPAFIDERYECDSQPVGGLSPPTWMDEEVFLRTAMADPTIQALQKQTADALNTKGKKAIEEQLQKLFETKYIEYIKQQFPKVRGLLAKWLMARAVWMKEEPKKKTRKAAK